MIRRRRSGETAARQQRNRQTLELAGLHEAISAEVERRPDATPGSGSRPARGQAPGRAARLAARGARHDGELGPDVQHAAPARADAQKKSGRAEEQDRADVALRRSAWRAAQGALRPGPLEFVDETGAATNMARRYGRSRRGRRLDGPLPHGHWKTTTLVAGLTTTGFVAPYVTDGAMNSAIFHAWTEQILAPTLRPGGLVIMDNLSSHKADAVRVAIEARGAELLYLPPYSPDRNPIEQAFAKLKALLRKAAQRIVDGPWSTIAELLDRFAPNECANYIANSGYPRSA